MRTSDSMLKDHSTLSLNCQAEDTLISSIEETLLSRLQTAMTLKFGISTKSLRPSNPRSTMSHSTSKMPEELIICKSGVLTVDGSKSSSTMDKTLSTSRMEEFLMSKEEKIRKDKTFSSGRSTMASTRDGRSFISMRSKKNQPRDSMKTADSTETDHSILSQDYQRREQSLSIPTDL